jgi:ribosomal protein S18 acetylase RimI-like enzyme
MLLAPAQDQDLPAIADLVNLAYRGDEAQKGWTTEAAFMGGQRTDAASLRADLAAKPGSTILTLRQAQGEKLAGCVWLEPQGQGVWLLGMLAVDPNLQAGGVGRALIEAAETHVRAQGGQTVKLTVIDIRDTLIAWYARRGYQQTGFEPFPYNDRRIGDTSGQLRFVVMEKQL